MNQTDPLHRRPRLAWILAALVVFSALPPETAAAQRATAVAELFDLQGFIDAQLATGQREIVIPPGRYRVAPQERQHLHLRGLRDITLMADGVEMICTETTRAITIDACRNVTLRGLTIDYETLPFTQAHITGISADRRELEVTVIPGYPAPQATDSKVEIFDPTTSQLRGRFTYYETQIKPRGPRSATIIKAQAGGGNAGEQIGDIAVFSIQHAPGGSMPHAIFASDSSDLVFDGITLFASPTFGFLEVNCDGSAYRDCRVDRRPLADDLIDREFPRMRSLNADAFHSKHARRGPRYERCTAYFMGDDAFAINGDFHLIAAQDGPVLRVLAKRDLSLRAGERVQLFTYDGRRLEDRTIVSIEPDAPVTRAERQFILGQQMNENLRRRGLNDGYRIELDATVEVPRGSVISSASAIGNGFVIVDCHLGFNRSRGILVKAGQGLIARNTIIGVRMTGILVAPEFWWLEAGFADDLTITGNRLSEGFGMGIAIFALGGDRSLAELGAFRRVTVTDNRVSGGPAPSILFTSIDGLTAADNLAEPDPAISYVPRELGAWATNRIAPIMRLNTR